MKIRKITPKSTEYPAPLGQIASAPKQLFALGAPLDSNRPHIAVVGSRKATQYGQEVTTKIVAELARQGIVIVSGLALGIDAIAHQTALEAGGRTIAVQACGLDRIYPATNRALGQRILEGGGTIISEYPVKTPPLKPHFPARNRIVSGISLGVLVTEAAAQSGSLITAGFALEQNREVFAVPGNITAPLSAGTNRLISRGAQLVTSAGDILEVLGLETAESSAISGSNKAEVLVLELLDNGIQELEELTTHSQLDPILLNQTITMLELNGAIKPLGGGRWIRN